MPGTNTTTVAQKGAEPPGDLEIENGTSPGEKVKKLKYPKRVFFILGNEFCERYSYYGMRTILALYLHQGLGYTEDMSTVIYHVFVMLCYFTPLIGGIMADSWIGKYKTILYVSILYAIGNIILALGTIQSFGLSSQIGMSMAGLVLIGLGTGGIKPCVSSFGGDQFVVPEQEKQLQSFFSVFYFSINAGSLLSCFFTPIMRENIGCLGQDTCDPLAFGIPAALMIISILFFILGKRWYTMKDPEGNIMLKVTKCICHAIARKWSWKKGNKKKKHWLDYSDDKFDRQLIEETKIFVNLAILFSPTIVFWALYEQQGSRWTFQASHMNGDLWGYNIDPDQIQTLNPIIVLAFIPVFDKWVYPLLAKLRLVRTPLQKISWGGILGALSFVISGILEFQIRESYAVIPHSFESHLRIYNNLDCPMVLSTKDFDMGTNHTAESLAMYEKLFIRVDTNKTVHMTATPSPGCEYDKPIDFEFTLYGGEIGSYLITAHGNNSLQFITILDKGASEVDKSNTTKINPKFKVIYGSDKNMTFFLKNSDDASKPIILQNGTHATDMYDDLPYGRYDVYVDNTKVDSIPLDTGGVYTLLLSHNSPYKLDQIVITKPNTFSMLWQIPQYFVISFAEIMLSITGMEFSFTEGPDSMKSVISSLWLITDAFGNIIILLIAGLSIFDNKAYEFFLYAGLMGVVMVAFIILAMRYTYVDKEALAKLGQKKEEPNDNDEPNDQISGL